MKAYRQFSSLAGTLITILCLGDCLQGVAATDPFLTLSQPVVTNGQVQFTLTGESHVDYVIEGSGDTQLWLPLVTNSSLGITRSISLPEPGTTTYYRASRQPLPVFEAAMVTRGSLDLLGNNILIDSYDSADPTHDDYLDPVETKDNGHVASGEGFIYVGNAEVIGKIKTSPTGSFSIGPRGSVGSKSWVQGGVPGVEPGWWENNYRFVLPEVNSPYLVGISPAPVAAGSNYWVLDGDYFIAGNVDLLDKNVAVTGNSRLVVLGDFVMRGSSYLTILPSAAFKLYVAGGKGQINEVNNVRLPVFFQYYGLQGNTNFSWSGSSVYSGTVYAPNALLTLGGGGTNTSHFLGACIVQQAKISGTFKVHFDENLTRAGPMR